MRIILIGFILILGWSQITASEIKLQIGWKIPNKFLKCEKNSPRHQTYTDIFDPFITKTIDDVVYTIAYDKDSRLITYINTLDSNFITKDNLRVGDMVELTKEEVSFYSKWEVYGPTTSDEWKPVIGYDRPVKIYEYESGQIAQSGNPSIGFENADKIKVKILSFSRSRK